MKATTAILLINVGTPDAPDVNHVRKYLFQFLNDRKVIDLPWLFQKLLVNLVIVPFRAPKSTKLYKKLWTNSGSPLLYYGEAVKKKLQEKFDDNTTVYLAMRYGNPDLLQVLKKIQDKKYDKLVVLPLFPQYATSTTGTAVARVLGELKKWDVVPELKIINQFYKNEAFLSAFVANISRYNIDEYDHVLFTYHGLPYSHIHKIHPEKECENCGCEKEMTQYGTFCYKAACYETTRLLAQKLQLSHDKYTVGFQSRLSKNWLHPFTDELILRKTKEGVKKILVVAPSFVADCLETTIELAVEYKELFLEYGGEDFQLVESLNDSDEWITALTKIIS